MGKFFSVNTVSPRYVRCFMLLAILCLSLACLGLWRWFSPSVSREFYAALELATILISLFVLLLGERTYRKHFNYAVMLVCYGFLAVVLCETYHIIVGNDLLSSLIGVRWSLASHWSRMSTFAVLATVLFATSLLAGRALRLGSSGKARRSTLAVGAIGLALLAICFSILVAQPLMQDISNIFKVMLNVVTGIMLLLGFFHCLWRGQWLSSRLEFSLIVCISFNLLGHFLYETHDAHAPLLEYTPALILRLFGYLALCCGLYRSRTKELSQTRRDERLIRMIERWGKKNTTANSKIRFNLTVSAKVALLCASLVVSGVVVTYTVFYAAFEDALGQTHMEKMQLLGETRQLVLKKVMEQASLDVQEFARLNVFEQYHDSQRRASTKELANDTSYHWRKRFDDSIEVLFARSPLISAVGFMHFNGAQREWAVERYDSTMANPAYLFELIPPSLLDVAAALPYKTHVSEIRGPTHGVWFVAQAVETSRGKISGVIVLQVPLKRIFSMYANIEGQLGSYDAVDALLLFDRNATLLWHNGKNPSLVEKFAGGDYAKIRSQQDEARAPINEFQLRYGDYVLDVFRYYYLPNNHQEYIELVQVASYAKAVAASNITAKRVICAGLAIIALVLLVGWFVSHTMLGPIRYLANAMLLFGERSLKVAIPTREVDEVGALANALDDMYLQVSARTAELEREVLMRQYSEQAYQRVQKQTEAASKAKSDFLAVLSHEIRTPMNGILGMAQLLSLSKLSHAQRDYLKAIENSGETLLKILNDMLDFSKIEAGKMELERAPFDLSALLRDVIQLYMQQIKLKRLEVELDYSTQCAQQFWGDENRIRQIMMNLISNAVKFTHQGKVCIKVEWNKHNEYPLVIHVIDDGIGISDTAKKALFVPFSQADSSTTRRFGGTGLGLAICHQLVELMGGEIALVSALNAGSCFSVKLPLQALNESELSILAQRQAQSHAQNTLHKRYEPLQGRVLLVEDTILNQKVASLMLTSFGFDVLVANNGHEAIAHYQANKGSLVLILMDCLMPEMDGYEATRCIRQCELANEHIPIIALTANAHKQGLQQCIEAGMDDCITKPVDRDELYTTLAQYVKKHNKVNEFAIEEEQVKHAPDESRYWLNEDTFFEMKNNLGSEFNFILEEFENETKGMLSQIDELLMQKQYQDVMRLAHSIKSSCAYLGAKCLQQTAKELEELAGEKGDNAQMRVLYSKLLRDFAPSMALMRQILYPSERAILNTES